MDYFPSPISILLKHERHRIRRCSYLQINRKPRFGTIYGEKEGIKIIEIEAEIITGGMEVFVEERRMLLGQLKYDYFGKNASLHPKRK